jgi:hypothetical protein
MGRGDGTKTETMPSPAARSSLSGAARGRAYRQLSGALDPDSVTLTELGAASRGVRRRLLQSADARRRLLAEAKTSESGRELVAEICPVAVTGAALERSVMNAAGLRIAAVRDELAADIDLLPKAVKVWLLEERLFSETPGSIVIEDAEIVRGARFLYSNLMLSDPAAAAQLESAERQTIFDEQLVFAAMDGVGSDRTLSERLSGARKYVRPYEISPAVARDQVRDLDLDGLAATAARVAAIAFRAGEETLAGATTQGVMDGLVLSGEMLLELRDMPEPRAPLVSGTAPAFDSTVPTVGGPRTRPELLLWHLAYACGLHQREIAAALRALGRART